MAREIWLPAAACDEYGRVRGDPRPGAIVGDQDCHSINDSVSLQLLLTAMQPVADYAKTNDPASWSDWMAVVDATLREDALPVPNEA